MASEQSPANKAELLARVHEARAALEAEIAKLSDDQLTSPTDDGGWSIKDHLAHIIDWQAVSLALLQGKMAHEVMGIEQDLYRSGSVDEINEALYEKRRDQSPSEVLAELRQRHQQILDEVHRRSDEELQQTYQPQRGNNPNRSTLINQINGTVVVHDLEHVDQIRRLAGAES
jgi:uncharacterized protein (TIGR03083 family)